MSDDLSNVLQRLVSTTGASCSDILKAVSALKSDNPLLSTSWTTEAVVQALPTIVEIAERSGTSVQAVAAAVRATCCPSPIEEP